MTGAGAIRALGVLRLEPNQPERVYRGGAGIARFRGLPPAGEFFPEDFVGSTTEVLGGGAGLSVLAATDTAALPRARIAELMAQRPQGDGTTVLLPAEADLFFRAERITVPDPVELDPGFAVLLVLAGEGRASWDGGTAPLRAGGSVLVPFGVGAVRLEGDATVLRCRPPAPRPPA